MGFDQNTHCALTFVTHDSCIRADSFICVTHVYAYTSVDDNTLSEGILGLINPHYALTFVTHDSFLRADSFICVTQVDT